MLIDSKSFEKKIDKFNPGSIINVIYCNILNYGIGDLEKSTCQQYVDIVYKTDMLRQK